MAKIAILVEKIYEDRIAGGLAPQDLAAAAFYTVYFLWLGLQNLLVPVALAIRPPGD